MAKSGQKNRNQEPGKPGTSIAPTSHGSQGIAGSDQDSSKQGSGQSRRRSRADQTYDKEEERQSDEAGSGKGIAIEGHDRIMPKEWQNSTMECRSACSGVDSFY